MSYTSKDGRRPNEYASKSSHGYIIRDPEVSEFLDKCNLPKMADEVEVPANLQFTLDAMENNPIKHTKYITSATEIIPLKNMSRWSVDAMYFTTLSVMPPPEMLGAIQLRISSRNKPNMVKRNAMN